MWSNVAALLAAAAAGGGNVRPTNANNTNLPSTSTPAQRVHAQATSSRQSCSASRVACDSRNGQSGTSSVHNRSSPSLHAESGGYSNNSDAESFSDHDDEDYFDDSARPAERKRSVFGSAGKRSRSAAHGSSVDNTTTHADSTSTTSYGNRSASSNGSARKRRVKHAERARDLVQPGVIRKHVFGEHNCKNCFEDSGEVVSCHHRLWAVSNARAVEKLTKQATKFLALNQEARRKTVHQVLEFEAVTNLHGDDLDGSPEPAPRYMVGASDGVKRRVCECVFLAHYPVSASVLRSIVSAKRHGQSLPPGTEPTRKDMHVTAGTGRVSVKTAHIIAWWLDYADATAEKLPDKDELLTPNRFMGEIYEEFVKDMKACPDVPAAEIACEDWFRKVFRTAPELSHIQIASGKENFGRCTTCTRLAHAIQKARKSGRTQDLLNAKAERLSHYKLERADKLHYYRVRQRARSTTPTNLSVITDKMDGNKNKVPSVVRPVKDIDEQLRDAMKLHVAGVIIHGISSDRVHLFSVAPNLAGNANLNIECLYMAFKMEFEEHGMLPELHVQVDNAADNKNRWVIGFFAWMIQKGYVKEVTVSFMMVGHTHEDIDALFKRIVTKWLGLGGVLSPRAFLDMLQAAVPDSTVHPILTYVHAWDEFFRPVIYDSVSQITTARVFVIRQRNDGCVAFWYKPDSSHRHLYPSAKDKDENPIETTIDGEKTIQPCEFGIEVLKTRHAPSGMPGLADFAKDTEDNSKARFNLEESKENIAQMLMKAPWLFPKAAIDDWDNFFHNFPRTMEDVVETDETRFTENDLPQCSLRLADGSALYNHQAQYRETIEYNNPKSGHRASANSLRVARAAMAEVPILKQGNLIAVFPPQSAMVDGERGERTPFWLAQIEMDEEPATDEFGRRRDPIDPHDEFMVSWLGVYDSKKGYPIITNKVDGTWMRRCKHAFESTQRWGHALQNDDQCQCCSTPEPQTDYISRSSILLYNIELTGKAARLNNVTRQNIIEAVVAASALATSMLPTSWKAAKKQAIKRQCRKR